jgi:tetratricopeptide (TPR) repeat protein
MREFLQAITIAAFSATVATPVMAQSYSDYDDILRTLDKAIASSPEDSRLYATRCSMRAMRGGILKKALDDCNKADELDPHDARVLNLRALIQYRLEDFAAAIADSSAAIALKPELASSFYVRGLARMRNGDTTGGNADVDTAKKLEPDVADICAKEGVRP